MHPRSEPSLMSESTLTGPPIVIESINLHDAQKGRSFSEIDDSSPSNLISSIGSEPPHGKTTILSSHNGTIQHGGFVKEFSVNYISILSIVVFQSLDETRY